MMSFHFGLLFVFITFCRQKFIELHCDDSGIILFIQIRCPCFRNFDFFMFVFMIFMFFMFFWLTAFANPIFTQKLFMMMLFFMLLSALLVPHGKVLATVFSYPVTEGSLIDGLSRGLRLSGGIAISQAFSRIIRPGNGIIGKSISMFTMLLSSFRNTTGNLWDRFLEVLHCCVLILAYMIFQKVFLYDALPCLDLYRSSYL